MNDQHAGGRTASAPVNDRTLTLASRAIFVGAAFLIASSILERDWISLAVGVGMATYAILVPRAWSRTSLAGRRTMNLLSAIVVFLVIVGIVRERL